MFKVKIFGAGSIGNHLSNASRRLGWQVDLCDIDPAALVRTRNDIYPARYGKWDEAIRLFESKDVPKGGYDLICIGTPPEYHLPIALQAIQEKPKAILVEKPLCPPSLNLAEEFYRAAADSNTKVFVGYDHVVGKATQKVEDLMRSGAVGNPLTLDVEFREHWGGIFKAHPWLNGPEDSYLGFWERGGGASGEHSHAANLWQHFAHLMGAGRVVEVDAMLNYRKQGKAFYDDLCFMSLKTENGFTGRVVQDVVTYPVGKQARIQGTRGTVEWVSGYNAEGDAVRCLWADGTEETHLLPKKRPDDFIEELKHLNLDLQQSGNTSPICLERGLDTMLVVAAAHYSERERCRIRIDYAQGYTVKALGAAGMR